MRLFDAQLISGGERARNLILGQLPVPQVHVEHRQHGKTAAVRLVKERKAESERRYVEVNSMTLVG